MCYISASDTNESSPHCFVMLALLYVKFLLIGMRSVCLHSTNTHWQTLFWLLRTGCEQLSQRLWAILVGGNNKQISKLLIH